MAYETHCSFTITYTFQSLLLIQPHLRFYTKPTQYLWGQVGDPEKRVGSPGIVLLEAILIRCG